MMSASIRPPELVRNQSSWSIAGAHYKHWATSLGNFGVTPFFGGNFSISLMHQCHLGTFTASQIVTEPSGTCHRLSVREDAHSQSFPTVYLSIETHVSKCVNWRLFISLMNQCHLDTFTASQIVTEPSGTCHRLSVREEAHSQSFPTVYLSIETHVRTCVHWRLFISLMNQGHLDTFTA